MTDESSRIKAEYERRARELPHDFYALHREAMLFAHQGRERALRAGLQRANLLPLTTARLLEVGCGAGEWFATFERFGLDPQRLAGLDLDAARIAQAKARSPASDLREGDATALPWPSQSFDLVFQSTVFSSILDANVQRRVADEMLRMLAPGGAIVSYDFSYNNPSNPNVRGVDRKALAALFPACRIELQRVTLAPPLARKLVPLSWALSTLLESVSVLNTHLLAVIRP